MRKRLTDADYRAFFGGDFTCAEFPGTPQRFDSDSFLGRTISSSHALCQRMPITNG